jgi:hypothetical protein
MKTLLTLLTCAALGLNLVGCSPKTDPNAPVTPIPPGETGKADEATTGGQSTAGEGTVQPK